MKTQERDAAKYLSAVRFCLTPINLKTCDLKEGQMKTWSKVTKQNVACLALLICLAAAAIPASAVTSNEVLRNLSLRPFTGPCCLLWGETVRVTEPRNPSAVVVTWTTDYNSSGHFLVGLSVNSRPCNFYGSRELLQISPPAFLAAAYQWVIFPSDGLVTGTNTFELCGGDADGKNGTTANIGFNTLTARIGN
jgi:hypothetical protein